MLSVLALPCARGFLHLFTISNNVSLRSLCSAHCSQSVWGVGGRSGLGKPLWACRNICTTYKVSCDLDDPQTLNQLVVTSPSPLKCSRGTRLGLYSVEEALGKRKHLQRFCMTLATIYTWCCSTTLGTYHSYFNLLHLMLFHYTGDIPFIL